MNYLKLQQCSQIVRIYFQNRSSVRETYKALRPFYSRYNRRGISAISPHAQYIFVSKNAGVKYRHLMVPTR